MGSKHSSPVFNLSTFFRVCVRLHQRVSLPTDSNTFADIIFQSCCQRGAYLSVWKMKNFTVPSNSAWPTPTMMMDMGSLAACRETNNKQIKGCVLKDENRNFFQLAERPLRKTGEEKWGVCYGGEWGGRGALLASRLISCDPESISSYMNSLRLLSWHGNMCDHCMLAIILGSRD